MDSQTISIFLFFFIGLLEIILSIPLIFEKIKPNYYYGFRTKKTLNDERVWYQVNKKFGVSFVFSGVLILIGMSCTLFLDLSFMHTLIVGFSLLFIGLLFSVIRGYLYLRSS